MQGCVARKAGLSGLLPASLACAHRPPAAAFLSPPTVLFTPPHPKTEAIHSVHPALSYGDSDGDIEDSRAADPAIRPVRIIRTPVSCNERRFLPGKFGEEMLANPAD
jgi:acid phosphatase class B